MASPSGSTPGGNHIATAANSASPHTACSSNALPPNAARKPLQISLPVGIEPTLDRIIDERRNESRVRARLIGPSDGRKGSIPHSPDSSAAVPVHWLYRDLVVTPRSADATAPIGRRRSNVATARSRFDRTIRSALPRHRWHRQGAPTPLRDAWLLATIVFAFALVLGVSFCGIWS